MKTVFWTGGCFLADKVGFLLFFFSYNNMSIIIDMHCPDEDLPVTPKNWRLLYIIMNQVILVIEDFINLVNVLYMII